MITQQEFDRMPEVQQTMTLIEHGRELLSVKKAHFLFKLYALADFYVEIRYDFDQNTIIAIHTLSLSEVMDSYGDDINITDAFNR